MIGVDAKSLLSRLNHFCTRSLEAAAGQCISRGHYEVAIEHVLLQLLDDPRADVWIILKHFEVDPSRVQKGLQRILEGFRSGNAGRPVFSPQLLEWIQEGWLIGSIDLNLAEVRSGTLLAALVANLGRYFGGDALQMLESIRMDELKRRFFDIIRRIVGREDRGPGESACGGQGRDAEKTAPSAGSPSTLRRALAPAKSTPCSAGIARSAR